MLIYVSMVCQLSPKEALLQKGESLSKQQRLTKGLAKLVSNTSEQQQAPQSAIFEEERQKVAVASSMRFV